MSRHQTSLLHLEHSSVGDYKSNVALLSEKNYYVATEQSLQKAQLGPFLAAVERRISARVEHLEALLAQQITLSYVVGVLELDYKRYAKVAPNHP